MYVITVLAASHRINDQGRTAGSQTMHTFNFDRSEVLLLHI